MLGPLCPVMKNQPEPDCMDKPLATTLMLLNANSRTEISVFTSGADGIFSLQAPPGSYVVSQKENTPQLPRCSSDVFTVTASKTTTTTVSCDTGIR